MAKKYDFDEPEGDGVFDQILTIVGEHKRTFAIASVSAAVILLGLVVWGTYPDNENSANGGSVPIVRADAGDYKTTPENPGGMEIPYRDSTVFSSGTSDSGTENILAQDTAEELVPRSQLFAGLNTEGQPVLSEQQQQPVDLTAGAAPATPPSNDQLVKEAIGGTPSSSNSNLNPILSDAAPTPTPAPAPTPAPVAEVVPEKVASVTTTPSAVKPATKPVPDKAADKAAKTEPAAGATTAAKAVTPGGYYIQVGSVRSASGADGEWKKIQAKYSGLSGLKYRTQEANLGAKGTFHRIQAGPMSKESATDICGAMKAKTPGSCLVTK